MNAGVEGTALKLAAKEWGAARGVHVEVVELPYSNLFEKEQLDLTSRTGAYDVIMMDDPWFPLMSRQRQSARSFRARPMPIFFRAAWKLCKPTRRTLLRAAICRECAAVFLSPGSVREI